MLPHGPIAIVLAFVLFAPVPVPAAGQAPATSARAPEVFRTIDREIDGCAAFVYRTREATRDNLVLMTDDLGGHVTRAWVNLGHGDVELTKVSYQDDEKRLAFVFEGADVEVRFDGTVTVPASERQEYSILRGRLTLKAGAGTAIRVVYVHNGC